MSSTRLEQWNERYRAGEQAFETPSPLVVQYTSELAPGSALDLASGAGRNALYLAEHGWCVTAVDGSPVGIDLLLARARERSVRIDAQVVDLDAGHFTPPAESHDLLLSCYYLQRSLIPVMKAALRRGALLIMIVHLADPDDPQGTPARASSGELRAFFDGWRILHYREGQPGESCHRRAVAEVVARKPE